MTAHVSSETVETGRTWRNIFQKPEGKDGRLGVLEPAETQGRNARERGFPGEGHGAGSGERRLKKSRRPLTASGSSAGAEVAWKGPHLESGEDKGRRRKGGLNQWPPPFLATPHLSISKTLCPLRHRIPPIPKASPCSRGGSLRAMNLV